jgi:predicted Zn-dependent protease
VRKKVYILAIQRSFSFWEEESLFKFERIQPVINIKLHDTNINSSVLAFVQENDIYLNKNQDLLDAQFLYSVMVHEIGHVLGLQHEFNKTNSVMYYSYIDRKLRKRLSFHDKVKLKHLYKKLRSR